MTQDTTEDTTQETSDGDISLSAATTATPPAR